MVSDMECIFCKIIRNEIQSFKIYESEKVVAVLDILPAARGQVLIIPKEHYQNFFEVPDDVIFEMFTLAKRISSILIEKFGAKGFHIVLNNGQVAGQTIPHVSVFVVPRYGNEQVVVGWQKNQASPEELASVQQELLRELGAVKLEKKVESSDKKEEKSDEELLKIVYMADVIKKRMK